ncbi:hypothetical protein NLG97_g6730 [Lecanicillium saksenae]|uniref:Uncharacterized protein n=1 Tax=Lecanicillium saksenae TaxID=468837 RepID=A0ACC1QQE1_9HYPO|nr:hypothetical protein NLG97_g6730 [Lecanicillium saksenae]
MYLRTQFAGTGTSPAHTTKVMSVIDKAGDQANHSHPDKASLVNPISPPTRALVAASLGDSNGDFDLRDPEKGSGFVIPRTAAALPSRSGFLHSPI